MKKVISSILILSIIFSFANFAKAEETTIKLGDYIQMGCYYGEPILWRCVAFEKITGYDGNGNPIIDSTDTVTEYQDGYLPLMLSDRIICLKAFDGKGTNTSGSHGRGYYSGVQGYWRRHNGSNYWADSNIRDWLNSTASAGNVVWSCGNAPTSSAMWRGYNAYNKEAGFLTNFTEFEKSAMKTVTQKSLLDGYEHSNSSNTINSNQHQYDNSISSVVQNYATAYSEQVTDTMFLLDVKQINTVYNNSSILGSGYYIGTPTAEAVDNSEYKVDSTKKWRSWLRSPHAANSGSTLVRFVDSDGKVSCSVACCDDDSGFVGGVRPAFYLNLSFPNLTYGSGSIENPFRSLDVQLKENTLFIKGNGPIISISTIKQFKNEATKIIIEDGVDEICDTAFEGFSNTTSIEIPNSVTSIGDSAFSGCSGLTSITIPEGVTSIGYNAFYNCSSLTSITIPDSVTSIGGSAFDGCSGLTTIEIQGGVTSIGNNAFNGCRGLTTIEIQGGVTSIGNNAFNGCSSLTTIEMQGGVTSIGDDAFKGCSALSSVTIPEGSKNIGMGAFSDCSSLTEIILPNSLESIGEKVFENCLHLKYITTPFVGASRASTALKGKLIYWFGTNYLDGMCLVDGYYLPSYLKKIKITSDDEITDCAFASCSKITEIEIGNKTKKIAGFAFMDCDYLKKVLIPSSVELIGNYAFDGANNVTIYGEKGSYVEGYAKRNNIPFVCSVFDYTDDFEAQINSSDENIVVTANVPNIKADKNIHAVVYDKNGKMIDYIIFPSAYSNNTVHFAFKKAENASYIKVFLWDSFSKLTPLSDSITLNVE